MTSASIGLLQVFYAGGSSLHPFIDDFDDFPANFFAINTSSRIPLRRTHIDHRIKFNKSVFLYSRVKIYTPKVAAAISLSSSSNNVSVTIFIDLYQDLLGNSYRVTRFNINCRIVAPSIFGDIVYGEGKCSTSISHLVRTK